jgi:hypothetical protein
VREAEMKRRIAVVAFGLGASLGALAGRPAAGEGTSVGKLAWLAGCWEGGDGERRIEEQWMRPDGGTMIGMSRTVAGGRTVEFEHLEIREEAGCLVYVARPSGQQEASFRSTTVTDSKVVFEDPAHDFPQRIAYERQTDGSLVARIEGEEKGKLRAVDFPMRRGACGARTKR